MKSHWVTLETAAKILEVPVGTAAHLMQRAGMRQKCYPSEKDPNYFKQWNREAVEELKRLRDAPK